MVGHSIGATFILSVLEKLDVALLGVFLISGFISSLGIEKFDKINKTFYEKTFNWKLIGENCIYIFHGDNDPYVSLEKSEEMADKLNSNIIVIKNGGHLNENAGFKKFPQLLEKIIASIGIY